MKQIPSFLCFAVIYLQNRKSFNFILHVKCIILVIIDLLEIKFLFQIKEEQYHLVLYYRQGKQS
jgi:hypothetical protein